MVSWRPKTSCAFGDAVWIWSMEIGFKEMWKSNSARKFLWFKKNSTDLFLYSSMASRLISKEINILLMMWQSCKLPKWDFIDSTSLNIVVFNSHLKCAGRVSSRKVVSSCLLNFPFPSLSLSLSSSSSVILSLLLLFLFLSCTSHQTSCCRYNHQSHLENDLTSVTWEVSPVAHFRLFKNQYWASKRSKNTECSFCFICLLLCMRGGTDGAAWTGLYSLRVCRTDQSPPCVGESWE